MTPKEKEVAKKIVKELVITVRMFQSFPPAENKKWQDGFMLGSKHMVLSAANLLKDKEYLALIESLIEWDKEGEKLFGKPKFKQIKTHQKKVLAQKKKRPSTKSS